MSDDTDHSNSKSKNTGSAPQTTDSDDISYLLISEATSLNNYSNLDDPSSLEAELSRTRGKSSLDSEQPVTKENDSNTYTLHTEEGRLSVNTGYVIRFVNEKYHDLSVFDIIGLDTLRAYPASDNLLDGLPPHIRGRLKDQGYVKVSGIYMTGKSELHNISLGWNRTPEFDTWDTLMQMISSIDSTPKAIDYIYIEYGPERWDVDEVAEARDVSPNTVKKNVSDIKRMIKTEGIE